MTRSRRAKSNLNYTNYYVVLFHLHDGDLVGSAPMKVDDYVAAIGEAQSRAQDAAGAIAFARTGNSATGEYEELDHFQNGGGPGNRARDLRRATAIT